ncbi:chloride transporter, ClC family [Dictyocaulus viviparus]|uniref:Chloride channel protein n=1 Tax=Dictyocaulus viviparus TaxID=29172 RepID=A0A0D8XBF3_DICVI|nr:chloride transporter, ClC family [Dictyocaulus viviparus]
MCDRDPLIHGSSTGLSGVARPSTSLDPHEDPVAGLERVISSSCVSSSSRRREEEENMRRRHREHSERGQEHALSSKYESLNYEVSENQLYRDEEGDPNHHIRLWHRSRNRWIVCFFIGVLTALVAATIDIMVHYSQEIKFRYIITRLLSKCDKQNEAGCMWTVEAAWMCYNCLLVGIAGSLVIFWAPIAGGSGIPQIKCYLNGIQIPEVVKLKTLISKAVGVACAVGGGLSAGKEGPMIHSGAVVGAGISQGRCRSISFDTGLLKEFRNDRERRDFVSAGAAAGVAAAFGAPIGGVLFSLEEGASFWNQNLTWRMFFAAMISAFTVNSILSWFNGRSGWLSWTGLANFGVFEVCSKIKQELQHMGSAIFLDDWSHRRPNWRVIQSSQFKKYVSSNWRRLVECLLVAAISAFTGFITLFLVDDCQPVGVNPNITEVNQMWCKNGEYSAVAKLFFQNPEESVKALFHSPINSFRPSTLLIFSAEYYLLTLWTFGLSVPAGVFIPAILTGAAWGRLFGICVGYAFPAIAGVDPGKYALAGAAAQLGGIVRMTISLTAIIMEATKDITFGLPIMLVLMVTKWVGDIFNEGLYDIHIDIQEIPILGWHPPKMSRNILAEKVMRSDVVAMERRERVARILAVLKTTNHHGFPVVDRIEESTHSSLPDYGHVKGVILRSQLITLLEKRVFYSEMDGLEGIGRVGQVKPSDFFDEDVQQDKPLDCLGLTTSDEQCWMDLEPFIHPHPHRVPLNASLPFIFQLFRLESSHPLGIIEMRKSFDGNYTGIFRAISDSRLGEHMKNNPSSTYRVFARSSTNPKDQLMSSTKTCLLLQSNLFHFFWITIDAERQLVLSLTVFPDIVATGGAPLDSALNCSKRSFQIFDKPSAVVNVSSKGTLPTPDTQLFVQIMERERRARQHGAETDDRSFLGKYWMYIVPIVIFIVVSNAMTPEGGGDV